MAWTAAGGGELDCGAPQGFTHPFGSLIGVRLWREHNHHPSGGTASPARLREGERPWRVTRQHQRQRFQKIPSLPTRRDHLFDYAAVIPHKNQFRLLHVFVDAVMMMENRALTTNLLRLPHLSPLLISPSKPHSACPPRRTTASFLPFAKRLPRTTQTCELHVSTGPSESASGFVRLSTIRTIRPGTGGWKDSTSSVPGETLTFFINSALIRRQALDGWNAAPKRLNGSGAPDPDGPIHLTGFSVSFESPNRVVTRVDGFDERPWPDVDFRLTTTDTLSLSGGQVQCTSEPDLDVDTRAVLELL